MASSGYQLWNVVAGEQPTTTKWNILGNNDASFNSGVGFNDGIITSRHLGSATFAVTAYTNPSTAGGTGSFTAIGAIKILWINSIAPSASTWKFIDWSAVGFTSAPTVVGNTIESVTPSGWVEFASFNLGGTGTPSTQGCSLLVRSSTTSNTAATVNIIVIGT